MSDHDIPRAPAADTTPEDPSNPALDIQVTDQHEAETFFKIKMTTKLGKLFNAHCERRGLQRNAVRFLLDGSRVQEEDTPETLQMEDGDMIEVVWGQVGGAGNSPAEEKSEVGGPVRVELKVKDQHGQELTFKIKRTTPLRKVMAIYCRRLRLDRTSARLFYAGYPVLGTDTPGSLSCEDGDSLDIVIGQYGPDLINLPPGPEIALSEPRTRPPAPEMLLLVVKGDLGRSKQDVFFKLKRTTRLRKLMDFYCRHQGVERSAVRFDIAGSRVRVTDTPRSLDLDTGDVLDAHIEQVGGGLEAEEDAVLSKATSNKAAFFEGVYDETTFSWH